MLRLFLALSLILGSLATDAQGLRVIAAHPPSSLRGLSAPAPGVLWTSGSAGTVGRSTDGGMHWTWMNVPGFSNRDFRDIEAFDSSTALIMGIDTPAVILRTSDGGAHWTIVLRDGTPGMFLDAMAFNPGGNGAGVVVGDPIPSSAAGSRFYLATTVDSGKTWHSELPGYRPPANSGEGCFASSGSNISFAMDGDVEYYVFVSGGPSSRLLTNGGGTGEPLPLRQGTTTTGANSLGVYGKNRIIVGGDFAHDTVVAGNCVYSADAGRHWLIPHTPPHGYRSCVLHVSGSTWICCGTSGIDISRDGGDHWTLVSRESFHVAAYPGSGKTVFLAGAKGRIAKLDF